MTDKQRRIAKVLIVTIGSIIIGMFLFPAIYVTSSLTPKVTIEEGRELTVQETLDVANRQGRLEGGAKWLVSKGYSPNEAITTLEVMGGDLLVQKDSSGVSPFLRRDSSGRWAMCDIDGNAFDVRISSDGFVAFRDGKPIAPTLSYSMPETRKATK